MNSRKILLLTSGVAPALASAALTAAPERDTRPNIVVILSDDMGWGQPGFNGGREVPTPNMDRLAKEGVKLTQFYASPVSSPTRATLLTGRYPFRNGMERRPEPRDTFGMLTDERTLANALHDAGYFTFLTGKWHLGQWYSKHLPLQRGFDYHYGFYSAAIHYYTHERMGVLDWHRNGVPLKEEGYSTFLIADEFVRVVEGRDTSKPFFAYVPFNAVHDPIVAPEEYAAKYPTTKNDLNLHYAILECLDIAIGKILKCLDDNELTENTMVVFFNDNGAPKLIRNAPYRGTKGEVYEGGIRVPCVVRWPGEVKPGTENDGMLCVADLYPTLVHVAGGSLEQPLPLDGMDIRETLRGRAPSPRNEVVHWLGYRNPPHSDARAIRIDDFKFIDPGDGKFELYNIREDPYEEHDIAAAHPDRVKVMNERLLSYTAQRREPEENTKIQGYPPKVYGESENNLINW